MKPIRSFGIIVISLAWLFVSVKQWVFDYSDISSLLFAIGFFLTGLYVAYDQWHKSFLGSEVDDIYNDIKAIDKKCNDLETKIIIIKNEIHRRK